MKSVALQNARRLDPSVQLVSEEQRVVNGRRVTCLQMEATYSQVPITFYGYYYGGTSGNLQVVTYTATNQFADLKPEFTELLNGLEIGDSPVAETPPRTLTFNDKQLSVAYDTAKWTTSKVEDDGRVTLKHSSGNGYALIIPEAISFPLDSFPEIALKNAQHSDPNAHIISQEKKHIQGHDIWCVRFTATISSLPFTYFGYYYSGSEGSIQVLTYTTSTSFEKAEPDFAELLNSLQFHSSSDSAQH